MDPEQSILSRLSTATNDFLKAATDGGLALSAFQESWQQLVKDVKSSILKGQLPSSTILSIRAVAQTIAIVGQSVKDIHISKESALTKFKRDVSESSKTWDPSQQQLLATTSLCTGKQSKCAPVYPAAEAYFITHLHNPNPNPDKLAQLAEECATDEQVLSKWFRETRVKLGYPALRKQFCGSDKAKFRDLVYHTLIKPDEKHPVPKKARDAIFAMRKQALKLLGRRYYTKERTRSSSKVSTFAAFRGCRPVKPLSRSSSASSSSSGFEIQPLERSFSSTPSLTDAESIPSYPTSPASQPTSLLFIPPHTPESLPQKKLKRKRSDVVDSPNDRHTKHVRIVEPQTQPSEFTSPAVNFDVNVIALEALSSKFGDPTVYQSNPYIDLLDSDNTHIFGIPLDSTSTASCELEFELPPVLEGAPSMDMMDSFMELSVPSGSSSYDSPNQFKPVDPSIFDLDSWSSGETTFSQGFDWESFAQGQEATQWPLVPTDATPSVFAALE